MTPSLSGLLIGALAFAIAFGLAKFLSVRKQRRSKVRDRQLEHKAQSRQVRRARERKGR